MFNISSFIRQCGLSQSEFRFLVENMLKRDYGLLISDVEFLSELEKSQLEHVACKIRSGMPVEYVISKSRFMGFDLYVDPNVLIPRSETEILVEYVVKQIAGRKLRVLDVGTGSGCISIAVASMCKDIDCYAVDISLSALDIAKRNAQLNKLADISFLQADLASAFKEDVFDLVIANLPYVETEYIEKHKELDVEPILALDGGIDGLDVIRRLLQDMDCLKEKGLLILEIGNLQKSILCEYVNNISCFEFVECIKDYSDHDRIFVLRKLYG